MKTLILLILSLPLAAQVASQDIAVLFGGKRGLSRSGLAAGVQTGSVNLILYSEPTNISQIPTRGTAISIFSEDVCGLNSGIAVASVSAQMYGYLATMPLSNGTQYTISAVVRMDDLSEPRIGVNSGSTADLALNLGGGPTDINTVTALGNACYFVTGRLANATYSQNWAGPMVYPGYSQKSFKITRFQLNEGSTALPYVATADLQSIASLPPGTATITRGANTGASTDDPTVSLAGWTFDSGDRVSGLPAKGANWTTTNCSGVECYTVTSGGAEYVNGVPRRNLLRWSEDLTNSVWSKGSSVVVSSITGPSGQSGAARLTVGGTALNAKQDVTVSTSTTYVADLWVRASVTTALTIRTTSDSVITEVAVTGDQQWVRKTFTAASGANSALRLVIGTYGSFSGGDWLEVYAPQLNLGSTALEYQKTTDSREWALETVGNYTGLVTWWGRWDRVLSPGEVLRNYRQWIRPQANARGNSLP